LDECVEMLNDGVADVVDEISQGVGDLILDLGWLRFPQREVRPSARLHVDVHPSFGKGKDSDDRAACRPGGRSEMVGHFHAIEGAPNLDIADSINERGKATVFVGVG
jgi:hypothetical protein